MITKGGGEGMELISTAGLRNQLIFSGLLCLLTFLFAALLPNFPFHRNFAWLNLVSALSFLAAFPFVERLPRERYFLLISALSGLSLLLLGGMVHFTGGITSPFIFFYFAIMLCEAAYGVESGSSIFLAALSYLAVTLGEAYGLLRSYSQFSDLIYANKYVVFWLTLSTTAILLLTGYVGRIVMAGYRATAAREGRKVRALSAEIGELESYSQIGMVAHRIVHDIRTPLATALGYLELKGVSQAGDPEDVALLDDVKRSLGEISGMLTDITRFGRQAEAKREKINLVSFLNTMLTLILFYPGSRGIKFNRLFEGSAGLFTYASLRELRQIYFNLLKNSVEALEGVKKREITLGLRRDGAWVEISVSDSGPGVPPQAREALFRNCYTSKEKGTGVGLVITRELVLRNGGTIEYVDYKGKEEGGAAFVTRLPLYIDK